MGEYRVGRRNPSVIYWQAGDEPDHGQDSSLGYIADRDDAADLVRRANRWLEHVQKRAREDG